MIKGINNFYQENKTDIYKVITILLVTTFFSVIFLFIKEIIRAKNINKEIESLQKIITSIEEQNKQVKNKDVNIKTPNDDIIIDKGGQIPLTEKKLLVTPYTPQDINGNFLDIAYGLGLIGEFNVIEFYINGEINNDFLNFVLLMFGEKSGTFEAMRLSSSELDLQKTNAVFTKNKPLEIGIVLDSKIKLSTTTNEYLEGKGKEKNLSLWDEINPKPTNEQSSVVNFYVSIYDEKGNIGDNSQITNFSVKYSCKEGSNCNVGLCKPKENRPECLERLFGEGTSKAYSNYYNNILLK